MHQMSRSQTHMLYYNIHIYVACQMYLMYPCFKFQYDKVTQWISLEAMRQQCKVKCLYSQSKHLFEYYHWSYRTLSHVVTLEENHSYYWIDWLWYVGSDSCCQLNHIPTFILKRVCRSLLWKVLAHSTFAKLISVSKRGKVSRHREPRAQEHSCSTQHCPTPPQARKAIYKVREVET